MVQFRDLAIGKKLLLIIMGVCVISLLLSFGTFLVFDLIELRQDAVREVSTTANIIGHNCSAALIFDDPTDAKDTLATLRLNPEVLSAWVFSREGRPFASYRRKDAPKVLEPPQVKEIGDYFENGTLACYEPVMLGEKRIGTVYVQSDLRFMTSLLQQEISIAASVLILSIGLAFLLSTRLQRIITTPIVALGELARSVTRDKDYSLRGTLQGKDEVGDLVANFNRMLALIEKRDVELQYATEKAKASEQEARTLAEKTREINVRLEKENEARRVAEESLREYQEQLEELVEARTRDLLETNTMLSREISERRLAEKKIRESLEEKKLLLGEIHHRVKNNLQVISSLLDMTRRRTHNEEASTLLAEARSRIYTMALIHSQLYESEHFNRIDMIQHTRKLLTFVSQIYADTCHRVIPVIDGSGVYLSVTQAIPCAIVLNELISNVFKHAYGENESGKLIISLARSDDEQVVIHVGDEGRGVPEEVDVRNTETLGLKLAKNITEKQLRGEFELVRSQGTKISMTFPIDHDDLLIH